MRLKSVTLSHKPTLDKLDEYHEEYNLDKEFPVSFAKFVTYFAIKGYEQHLKEKKKKRNRRKKIVR